MASHSDQLDSIYCTLEEYAGNGLIQRTAEDERLDGRTVLIDGRRCINFGSCSYLGLELDPRVKQGAIEAIERYGTQFSSSRSYLSVPLYAELEPLVERIFGGPVIVSPNTTLGHQCALPTLVHDDDVVLIDHWAHATLRLAADRLRLQNVKLEVVPHSDLDRLESRICELRKRHPRIWYLADGVYSMRGDFVPIEGLRSLLDRYECLHLYLDDAHGVGWCGRHGRGYVLDRLPSHPRMIVAVSLNKCFGAGGGAIVFPDDETRRRVRTVGGPMIFTGPLQPASLGAAIASARIFLSPELPDRQRQVERRIELFNAEAGLASLPIFGNTRSPIRFVPMGLPGAAAAMVKNQLERGYWTNLAVFPAVIAKQAGVRSTMTLHQSEADVRGLVRSLAAGYDEALAACRSSRDDVGRFFGIAVPRPSSPANRSYPEPIARPSGLHLEHFDSVDALDAAEWDRLLGARGAFEVAGLRLLEKTFREHGKEEDEWRFHYFVVRDRSGRPVLATFFTEAWWKEDLVASARVSERVEAIRRRDPSFLVSRVLMMGSLLTEGNHLFTDRALDWRGALSLLLRRVTRIAEDGGIGTVLVRDLPQGDEEMDALLREFGFVGTPMPPSMVLEIDWSREEQFLERIGWKFRRFHRQEVLPWSNAYEVEVIAGRSGAGRRSEAEWAHLHRLYRNVRERSLEINSFELPEKLLCQMSTQRGWEILTLRLRRECGGRPDEGCSGFVGAYAGSTHYVPLLVGLDYERVQSHGLYRQCIRAVVGRAIELGCKTVHFGMGAELEKRRFGAVRRQQTLWSRMDDHFGADVMAQLAADVAADQASSAESSNARSRTLKASPVKGLARCASRTISGERGSGA